MLSFLPRRSSQQPYCRLHANIPEAEPISLLCLAGRQSTAVIEATALQLGLGIVKTRTLAEATRAWTDRRSEFGAVVLALGSDTDTYIFTEDSPSPLFAVAAASPAALIVFSHTACRNVATRSLLLSECGCDAVVNSGQDLADALVANCLHQQAAMPPVMPAAAGTSTAAPSRSSASPPMGIRPRPSAGAAIVYGPLQHRRAREAQLRAKRGGADDRQVLEESIDVTDKLAKQFDAVPGGSVDPWPSAGTVRVVHISDTHNCHDRVVLPPGDLLLHTGDIVGNYGRAGFDPVTELASFLDWLGARAGEFKHVVFCAGNHDTMLDTAAHGHEPHCESARALLKAFLEKHRNVRYLENSGTAVLGLRIWGTPLCPSRLETQGQRYYSNAFERKEAERRAVFAAIPDNLDILMTHPPPMDNDLADKGACPALSRALRVKADAGTAPRLVAFGHCHRTFGVTADVTADGKAVTTLYMNAAQDRLLQVDEGGGGTALVCDLAVPASNLETERGLRLRSQ